MYLQIKDKITQLTLHEIDATKMTIGLIPAEELEQACKFFGFSDATVKECRNEIKRIHGTIDVYDDYHFGIINGIDSENILKMQDRIAIFIRRNLFLIVVIEDEDNSISTKLSQVLERLNLSKVTLEKLICAFLERLISEDYNSLEEMEEKIASLEESISSRQLSDDFPSEITDIRKRLLILHNFYDQLIVMGETLQENENDLFLEEKLRYFTIFTNRVARLNGNTQMLQDYCAHVKEAYHAQLDNNLNSVMETFTVVAAIFLPLTLIAGWYGMNFKHMPELGWRFGYPLVMAVSLAVVIFTLHYFRKKKFF